MGSQSGKQDDREPARDASHKEHKHHKHHKHSKVESNHHPSSSSSGLPHFGYGSQASYGMEGGRPTLPDQRIPLPDFGPEALKSVEQEIYLKQAIGEFTFDRDPDLQWRPPELVCRDPYFWTRKDDWLPNDPFREWRKPPRNEMEEEKKQHQLNFLDSLAKTATTPIAGEDKLYYDMEPSETLLAGAPLRHRHREKKVPMLPFHGEDEAYAVHSSSPASTQACIGEIIHPPVLDVAAIAERASRPPSMVRPPPSMVWQSSNYVGSSAFIDPGLRSQVASSMVLPQGPRQMHPASLHSASAIASQAAPSYQGSWPASAVRVY